jgi:hypothetical protein
MVGPYCRGKQALTVTAPAQCDNKTRALDMRTVRLEESKTIVYNGEATAAPSSVADHLAARQAIMFRIDQSLLTLSTSTNVAHRPGDNRFVNC